MLRFSQFCAVVVSPLSLRVSFPSSPGAVHSLVLMSTFPLTGIVYILALKIITSYIFLFFSLCAFMVDFLSFLLLLMCAAYAHVRMEVILHSSDEMGSSPLNFILQ